MKRLLTEDVDIDIYTIEMLFSYDARKDVETGKLENILRAVPNVTVVSSLETIKRGGNIYIRMMIKINSLYIGNQRVESYIRNTLIPSIKKNSPTDYRPNILDWKVIEKSS
tara:strand:- start:122 stop:454 length:333 start_codon:yes stop_codon:yes gene_type:complete